MKLAEAMCEMITSPLSVYKDSHGYFWRYNSSICFFERYEGFQIKPNGNWDGYNILEKCSDVEFEKYEVPISETTESFLVAIKNMMKNPGMMYKDEDGDMWAYDPTKFKFYIIGSEGEDHIDILQCSHLVFTQVAKHTKRNFVKERNGTAYVTIHLPSSFTEGMKVICEVAETK